MAVSSFQNRKNQEGNRVVYGGELIFSKVFELVSPPCLKQFLLRKLESQGKGGFQGGETYGLPYGDSGELTLGFANVLVESLK